jgi:cyclic 2,3-diphosphoglycerate synthetase
VETRRRVLVVNSRQDHAVVTGYLNTYRQLLSELVVLTMADEGSGWEELRDRIAELGPRVVGVTLSPRPLEPVEGRRVAFFTTAGEAAHAGFAEHLSSAHGADVVHVSGNLADRRALAEELETVDADVFLIELKAAAIDVVAEAGRARGIDIVLAGSDVRSTGERELDAELLRLADEATA